MPIRRCLRSIPAAALLLIGGSAGAQTADSSAAASAQSAPATSSDAPNTPTAPATSTAPSPVVPFGTPKQVDPTTAPADTASPTSGVAVPAQPVESAPAAQSSPAPVPARTESATPALGATATPLLHYGDASGFNAQLTGNVRIGFTGLQPFASDRDGTQLSPTPFETRIRLAPVVRYANVSAIGEVDLMSGALVGLPSDQLHLGQSAHPLVSPAELRQLYLEYRGETFAVRAGQQTSNWGLGLVANNGAQDAAPGEFGDAHYGDLTWRAAIAGRPLFALGGAFRAIEPIIAADLIVRDDTANYWKGDRAWQGVLALRFNVDADRNVGVYTVYRTQSADGVTDGGRETDAYIVDAAGKWKWADALHDADTKLGFEAAWITGRTTLIRSDTAPELALRQFGAVVKGSVRRASWEGYLDLGYASGDQNPYDDKLDSFRFDADYKAGLILFQELMAWQSARTYARAIDPNVTGYPQEGVDLLPTRGAVTGATYAFPRVRKGIREWLDVYGGPLFAWSTASMVDPFNTRIAGGTPRNALGGKPGSYLGTEVDLGVQARLKPVDGMALNATAEVGYLVPGGAFAMADGTTLAPIAAGRIRVGASF